jgi:hypothetical protein
MQDITLDQVRTACSPVSYLIITSHDRQTLLYTVCPRRESHSIGHSKQKIMYVDVSYTELFHCTDEQHVMSSHELQTELMLTVNCTNFVT